VLEEIDGLLAQGVRYIYFIDELFLPDVGLLASLAGRDISFGIQTRIDLWSPEMLDALGEAGCVSIEAGVESVTEEGRNLLGKKCALEGAAITARLAYAKKKVPFVQASLLFSPGDDRAAVERWREDLMKMGVWVNKPVPLFPYPGSAEYEKRWGAPDDLAWERAHLSYLECYGEFSDIQSSVPLPIEELELTA
jgi:B12-binding domain/radical SAM domain protein of rhizo-twelve system